MRCLRSFLLMMLCLVGLSLQGGGPAPFTVELLSAAPTPATSATLTANLSSPQTVGTAVTFTATGYGSDASSYIYRFYLGGTVVQNGLSNTWTMPASTPVGTYAVGVVVSADPTVWWQTEASLPFTLNPPTPTPATSATLTTSLSSPQAVGTAINFTATGHGSNTTTYLYRFYLNGAVVQNGYGNTWTLPATTPAGTYAVGVVVSTDPTVWWQTEASLSFTIGPPTTTPATSVTLTANLTSPQQVGTAVTFTAAGHGSNTSNYIYRFYFGGAVVQNGPGNTWTMPASTQAGTYSVGVVVSADPTVWWQTEATLPFTINPAPTPATSVTLTASLVSPQMAGTAVTFTAVGHGSNTSNYIYRFYLGGVVVQNGPGNTWTMPASTQAGTYSVGVVVSADPTVWWQTEATLPFTINPVPTPATSVTLTASLASPQMAGTAVTFTAAGHGSNTSNYIYRFYLNGAVIQNGSSSTWIMPASTSAGTYAVGVVVSADPTIWWQTEATLPFTINPIPTPATSATLTANFTSPQLVGTAVTFTAVGHGSNTSNYIYRFYLNGAVVQNGSSSTWTMPASTPVGTYGVGVVVSADPTVWWQTEATLPFTLRLNAAPVFQSAPATTNGLSSAYQYIIQVSDPDGDPVTLTLTNAPAGAVLNGTNLSWTIAKDQERKPAAFVVRATDSFGAATDQAWTVNATGTITGTKMTTYHTATGTQAVPVDLSTATIAAWVPDGAGGFSKRIGSGLANGTFSIPGVPEGVYLLQFGATSLISTSASVLDLGTDAWGRSNPAKVTVDPTNLVLNLTNLAPWQGTDYLQWFDDNTGAYVDSLAYYFNSGGPMAGATALSSEVANLKTIATYGYPVFLEDTNLGDAPRLFQLGTQTVQGSGQTYQTLVRYFAPSPLTQADGVPSTLTGTFATVPLSNAFPYYLKGSEFSALQPLVHPQATPSYSQFFLDTNPAGIQGAMASTPDLIIMDTSTFDSTDQALGNLAYGNPFSASWPLWWQQYYSFSVPYQLPGVSGTRHMSGAIVVSSTAIPSAGAPIRPGISPVRNVGLDGASLSGGLSGVELTPTIAWQAPAQGTSAFSLVSVYRLYKNGTSTLPGTQLVASLRTSGTSIQVPPGYLVAGETYCLRITAYQQPSYQEIAPYRPNGLNQAWADCWTATFTAGTGAVNPAITPATGVTLLADRPSPQAAGTPIQFMATGQGSNVYQGIYLYRFYLNGVLVQSGYQNLWTLPASTRSGSYTVGVAVSADPAIWSQASTSLTFTLMGNSPPVFWSSPSTVASSNPYLYAIQVSDPDGDAITLSLPSAPAGAILNGNLLQWTIGADQQGKPASFVLRATDSQGAFKEQAWTVDNAGTVTGTKAVTYHNASGTQSIPVDLSTTAIAAWIPDGLGGFTKQAGVGLADGTFSIPGVPSGQYLLQVGPTSYQATSARILDLGTDAWGRVSPAPVTVDPTNLVFNLSNLAAWQDADQLQWFDSNTGTWTDCVPSYGDLTSGSPVVGDTSLNGATFDLGARSGYPIYLEDTTKGDSPWWFQLSTQTISGSPATYQTPTRFFQPNPLVQTDGATSTLTGAFAPVPLTNAFPYYLKGSEFAALTTAVHPLAQTSSSYFFVDANPTSSLGLLASTPDVLLMDDSGTAWTDQNLGNLPYGNPFPASWPVFWQHDHFFRVPYTLAGLSGTRWVSGSMVQRSALMPSIGSPIRPVLSPVQSVQVDGVMLNAPLSGTGLTPTISWQAPAIGTPTHSLVSVYRLYKSGTLTSPSSQTVATFRTSGRSLQLPPNLLLAGETYRLMIRTYLVPGYQEGAPNRLTPLELAWADCLTQTFTAGPPAVNPGISPATGATLQANLPSPQNAGTPVMFMATGTGSNTVNYVYRFFLNGVLVQNGYQNIWTLPSSTPAGTYTVGVAVSADPAVWRQVSATTTFAIIGGTAPVFLSAPPTANGASSTYQYLLQAYDPQSRPVTFALVSAPAGATIMGNTLQWTVSPAQERSLQDFLVRATNDLGASADQAWTVRTSGTVTVSSVTDYHTASGVTGLPATLTPGATAAWVPDGLGGFTKIPSVGQADGSVTLPHVPYGTYYLQNLTSAYVETASSVNLGTDIWGRSDRASIQTSPTNLVLNLTSMTPWQPIDSLTWFDAYAGTNLILGAANSGGPLAGDTALVGATYNLAGRSFVHLENTALGDSPVLLHSSALSVPAGTGGSYLTPTQVFTPFPLVQSDGVSTVLSGGFSTLPMSSSYPFTLNGADFDAQRTAVSPLANFSSSSFSVVPNPAGTAFYNSAIGSLYLINMSTNAFGTTNQGQWNLPFGNPFPADWPLLWNYGHNYAVYYTLPGAASSVGIGAGMQVRSAQLPSSGSPITPKVTPVRNATLGGQSLNGTVAGVGLTPLLAWDPPSVGTATFTLVIVNRLYKNASNLLSIESVLSARTQGNNLQILPGVLVPGETYVFTIRAYMLPTFQMALPNRTATLEQALASYQSPAFTP